MSKTHATTYGGHIEPRAGIRLIVITMISMLFLHYPVLAISWGGPATWQLVLMVLPLGLVIFWLYTKLANRFPGASLCQMAEAATGRLIGALLMVLVLVWLMGHLTLNLRDFTETFKTTLLPITPISIISLLLILCAAAAAWTGLEGLARVSQLLFVPIYLMLALVVVLNLPHIDASQYFPFWGFGLKRTALGALAFLPMLSEITLLLILGQVFRSARVFRQVGRSALIIYILTGLGMVLLLVGLFGSPDAQINPFALFSVARLISIGRWVERIEAVMIAFWVMAACVRISLLLYAACLHLAQLLRIPNHRPLVLPLLLIAEALSVLPEDFAAVLRTDQFWMQTAGAVALAIPPLILIVAVMRKKGGHSRAS
ncbi:MAG TPA: endospore germination permease [Symbiobacteriaceae bacterium]|nr:endospore germination permease [Symbiobacteriaceae bacterium]